LNSLALGHYHYNLLVCIVISEYFVLPMQCW